MEKELFSKKQIAINRSKLHYKNNREEVLKKMSEKVTCPLCARKMCKSSLINHRKSKLCAKYAEQKQVINNQPEKSVNNTKLTDEHLLLLDNILYNLIELKKDKYIPISERASLIDQRETNRINQLI